MNPNLASGDREKCDLAHAQKPHRWRSTDRLTTRRSPARSACRCSPWLRCSRISPTRPLVMSGRALAESELGPGTGQVTIRIARLGASVTAVEPDRALAACLAEKTRDSGLTVDIRISPFEDAALPSDNFDIAVAATSFHWIDQAAGLRKVRQLLVPRGWWAMCGGTFSPIPAERILLRGGDTGHASIAPESVGGRRWQAFVRA